MNPSYMTRQIHEMETEQCGLRGHITSLNPIRPANAADTWEIKALQAFEQGVAEVSSVEKFDNKAYMRLMSPMVTEQSCLKCHAEQGYKVGDLRGGISVSVPMAPLQAVARGHMTALVLGHGLIWLLGLGGISVGGLHLKRRIREADGAEEQIREQREFLRSTIESLGHPFYVIDANDYTIKIANSAAQLSVVNEMSTCYALIHKEERPCGSTEHPCPLEIIKDTKQPAIVEHIHYGKDGNVRNIEVHGFPIFDNEGNVVQVIEYYLDITERKQAVDALQKARNELEKRVQERTAELLNANEQLTQKIEELKRTEEALRKAHDELEERIEERTAELARANKVLETEISERKRAEKEVEKHALKLEVINKDLESFTYSVSHDLRTPLRAINGFSQVLLESKSDRLDTEGKRVLNLIVRNTNTMGQLIDDLLAFCRLGRQEMRLSDVNMEKLANEVFLELKSVCPERKIQFVEQALPPARGDRRMLRHIFVNLLSNAIKFTSPREKAVIEVGGQIREDENIYYLKDNGVGFDMNYVHKVFSVFQRLHSQNEFEGTGVGLAIVLRIIERHGGRVWIEGKVDVGTTVYFAIPRGKKKTA
jgi:signal transduction histidine kinase